MSKSASPTDDAPGVRERIAERVEAFVSYGQPTCDVCRGLPADGRPDEGGFWPDEPVRYIRAGESSAVEWNAATVCPYHDTAEHRPEGVTHRVETTAEYIGRQHRMNSAYANHVQAVDEVDQ